MSALDGWDWERADMSRSRPEKVVNMDALLRRDDFFIEAEEQSETNELRVTDLEPGITFNRLRKPDFQRETSNWTPKQTVDLIETFAAGDIIPAIILWESGSRIFVVDGAHRLSALIGWIQDDFGAGALSQKLYGTLELLGSNTDNESVWRTLSAEFKSVKRDEEEEQEAAQRGTAGASFPLAVKNAATLADLRFVPRCQLCGGLKHRNGVTLDHRVKRSEGGKSSFENSRWVHPICNENRDSDEQTTAKASSAGD